MIVIVLPPQRQALCVLVVAGLLAAGLCPRGAAAATGFGKVTATASGNLVLSPSNTTHGSVSVPELRVTGQPLLSAASQTPGAQPQTPPPPLVVSYDEAAGAYNIRTTPETRVLLDGADLRAELAAVNAALENKLISVSQRLGGGRESLVLGSIKNLDSDGSPTFVSLALDSQDRPRVSYADDDPATFDLKIAICSDPHCSAVSVRTLDSAGSVGRYTTIALSSAGNPVVAYEDATNFNPKLAICSDPICSGAPTLMTVDASGSTFGMIAMALDQSDRAMLVYPTGGNMINFAVCNSTACSTRSLGVSGFWMGIALDSSGHAVIAYTNAAKELTVARCGSLACTSPSFNIIDSGRTFAHPSVAIRAGDIPVVAWYDQTATAALVAICADVACASAAVRVVHDGPHVGSKLSLVLGGPRGDRPFLSYAAYGFGDMVVAMCRDSDCTLPPSIRTVSSIGSQSSSIKLSSAGYPRVAIAAGTTTSNQRVELIICEDPTCI